ncbi:MAG: ribbon-helix-helix protein, CopG family [Armatimonadota bacterium]|nr:ribbon-helix-helix protein, CopG family [Armatimonadota bacterium]
MPRYTIDLGTKLDKLLDDLATSHEITKSEIIRRAVASYAYLDEERSQGKKISIVDEQNRTVKEVVLP